jgi:hypothetical protein
MFLETHVEVTISNNAKYYASKGYGYLKQRSKVMVKVEDLPTKSHRHVFTRCDCCSKEWFACYANMYNKETHRCFSCNRKYVGEIMNTTKIISSNSNRIGENHPRFNPNKPEFKEYWRQVKVETDKNNLSLLENSSKRGKAGVNGAYHLDHIISVKYGFDNNISPIIIGSKENLRFISWEENYKKRAKNGMALGTLFALIEISNCATASGA